jgi:imidazolonepropionase-like amidohydrolase
VHDELTVLVQSGLTPMAALQTVTRDAARYLGREATMGTVTDLLVLDRNPLTDIRNTQAIHAVVTRGRLIESAERQRMLVAVEEAASRPAAPATIAANLARMSCGCHG